MATRTIFANLTDGLQPLNLFDLAFADCASLSGSNVFNLSPVVFNLAGGALGANILLTTSGITVPANTNYSDIRASQTSGANNTFIIGAGGIVASIFISPEALAGSDATSNLYGAVLHATNNGPGTVRGIHAGAFATGTSSGSITAVLGQISPAATSSTTSAAFATSLTGGISDIASGMLLSSSGDRYLLGWGSVGPIPYKVATFRAYMANSSGANARAFQILNNAGTEIGYWDILGNMGIGVTGQPNVPQLQFAGRTSQFATISPQDVAGNGVLLLPQASGTLVSTAALPLSINASTGQISISSAILRFALTGVNFNSANTDNAITITLPAGVSRYVVQRVTINNASASISTATMGVFTATGGGGQTIAATQAITVTATTTGTNNNTQSLATTNSTTEAYTDSTLQIRIGAAQGSAATADVIIHIFCLT